jgi:hypothetical protein
MSIPFLFVSFGSVYILINQSQGWSSVDKGFHLVVSNLDLDVWSSLLCANGSDSWWALRPFVTHPGRGMNDLLGVGRPRSVSRLLVWRRSCFPWLLLLWESLFLWCTAITITSYFVFKCCISIPFHVSKQDVKLHLNRSSEKLLPNANYVATIYWMQEVQRKQISLRWSKTWNVIEPWEI